MKRYVAAAALAAGLWSGLAAPAGAIIINGHIDVAIGNPDIRIAVVGEMAPCIAEGDFDPCIVDGGFEPCIAGGRMEPCIVEVDVRVDTRSGRS
jgi:hypothetical protein